MFKFLKINYKFLICFTLFLILTFTLSLGNSFNYLDTDLGWHLRAGSDIYTQRTVSLDNFYNYTLASENWINHEWLADFLAFSVFDNYGYIVLNLFFTLFLTIILLVLFGWLKRRFVHKSPLLYFSYFPLSLFGLIAISPHVGVRMQVLGLLMFLLFLVVLDSYSRKKNWKKLVYLPFLFLIWANIHASFLLGLIILVFWFGVKLVERLLHRWSRLDFLDFKEKMSNVQGGVFIIFSILSFLATLINPFGLRLYEFLGGYKNNFYLTHIQEWLPQYAPPINYWQLSYLALFVAFLAITILEKKHKPIKLNSWLLALSVVLLVLSFQSKRHFPLFFIGSFPLMVQLFVHLFKELDQYLEKEKLRNLINDRFVVVFGLFVYILTLASLSADIKFNSQPFNNNYCDSFPCEAVEFIKNDPELKDLRIFNHYGWGGYFIWNWPEKQLFIDGRMPQLEYKEHTILEEYFEFFAKETVAEKLEEHNIELVLMPRRKEVERLNWYEEKILHLDNSQKANQLYDFLDASVNWQKDFYNDTSMIYVKRAK